MPQPDMIERVRVWLGWEAEYVGRLEALAAAGSSRGGLPLSVDGALGELLARLDVPSVAAREIEESMPDQQHDPEAWWLLEHLYHRVVDRHGTPFPPPWPSPEPADDALSRYFHLYAYLAAVPDVLRLHGGRGVPAVVTWSTLRDLGLQVANYHFRNGRPGFDGAFWMWQHFRGEAYRLGRLQYTVDDPDLGVHIPALGPLTPKACDASLAQARDFFSLHFPERGYRMATCSSWLMDPQLAEYLDADSNIMLFQSRFEPVPGWSRLGDDDVVRFVFGFLPSDRRELPLETSLQRAIVSHLDSGRHWEIRRGRLEL